MEIIGNPPINKYLFTTGKLSTYLTWTFMPIQAFFYNLRIIEMPQILSYFCIFLFVFGFFIFIISSINLGNSLRFGLPTEKTEFKTNGLYRFSRNPLYFGFYLMNIGSIFYTASPIVIIISLYGIFIIHKITLAEELYMKKEFGKKYEEYCRKVRRYI
jgi:protein-S-isoprenylcysteine O-methyltransferase Ste14